MVLDALTLGVVATISYPAAARDAVVSPDGRFAYVAIDSPAVSVVDLQTLTEAARISLSPTVAQLIAIAPDGNTVYAICS